MVISSLMQLIPEYTVSELVRSLKTIIEGALYYVRVTGEVSNLRTSSAGHTYFTLKDSDATINVVFFGNPGNGPKFRLEDGLSLLVRGRLTIYEERSVYQIIAEGWETWGVGSLLRIVEERKNRLKSEGLFDVKKPIPKDIRRVGIITAPGGAAIRDIEVCLGDRLPIDSIILYPTLVQGQNADVGIIRGIKYFNNSEPTDVIVITRGGGSMEDLMCFNGEALAREVFNSKIPVVTAIGHETDWTLVDYVSDMRLPTPTAVAGFLRPLKREAIARMELTFRRILKNSTQLLRRLRSRVEGVHREIKRTVIRGLSDRLARPRYLERRLLAFSRRKILRLGYAVVRKGGKMVTHSAILTIGDRLEVEILDGKFTVSVLEMPDNPPS
jgi:exodeoxyribonuclease VII large subunit